MFSDGSSKMREIGLKCNSSRVNLYLHTLDHRV